MKIAITGSNGLLGSTLIKLSSAKKIQTIGVSREEYLPSKPLKDVVEYFKSKKIEAIIHCAANTNVELCETEVEQCYLDNVLFTEVLANVCDLLGMKLVFISSTGIYGETQNEPYCEYSDVKPTTVHHHSKLCAERSLSSILSNYLIIRTGWLFGGEWENPKNFVANRIKDALKSDGCLFSDSGQKGCPSYVNDVANRIFDLLSSEWKGVFNCVNTGYASRYDYVSAIVKYSKLEVDVVPAESKSFNRRAKVSKNEAAVNMKLKAIGFEEMPYWERSLELYICKQKEMKYF